jgi:ribosomal protein S18 acetylase RimI-like enzyme
MHSVPASQFTFEQLTDAYNRSRVDYLVPMPMNVARMREYVAVYDVDLDASFVIVDGEEMLGIGMLGVRPDRAWITRMGVLPSGRRRGIGRELMNNMVNAATARHLAVIWLEVIKDNIPAYHLFCKFGFVAVRELLVARRAPAPQSQMVEPDGVRSIQLLDRHEALDRLANRSSRVNWLIETESMQKVPKLSGIQIELDNGGQGWVSYQAGMMQLTHIVLEVQAGDPVEVATKLLQLMHRKHPVQDAILENIADDDPAWPAFVQVGYFEAFRRSEMRCDQGMEPK